MHSHSLYWESYQMAKAFLDRGYNVDIIHWLNDRFVPKKEYAFFIDIYLNLERIGPMLKKDCVKVLHLPRAHWIFQNKAEYERLFALKKRRGVALKPRRQMEPSWAIEYADFITILGNNFTISTYNDVRKPIIAIPVSTVATYPFPEDKNYELCRKTYLWFGSRGLVHKGLDLVLDSFVEMPDYHLYVCGPIEDEKDFEKTYYKELYQTPNIHTPGWVDVPSPIFLV